MFEKIQDVFEKAGVEFLPRSGVCKKDIVEIYAGEDSEKRLIEDIQKTMRNMGNDSSSGREILIAHLKEDEARKNLGAGNINAGTTYIEGLIRERREAGVTHRLLVRADDEGLFPVYDTYHVMPDKYFSDHPLYIYGTKLAILAWHPAKSVVIDDARFADCARKLFNFIWDNTQPVEKVAGEETKVGSVPQLP